MMDRTGCDGVVVGRGCLGRPWLFRDLADVMAGRSLQSPPASGEVAHIMVRHAGLLVDHFGERVGIALFRKHPSWYLKGFPAGPQMRDALARVESVDQLEEILADWDRDIPFPEEANRMVRGHSHGPRPVRLPHGFLDHREGDRLGREAEQVISGG
jgi:tRNA-dihydrouridine synthase